MLVSIPDRKLAVLEDGRVLKVFPVAVGADDSPSPDGEFQIINRLTNPTYYHPGTVIPAGPANPLGSRWIGLSLKGYGIHGTNAPRSIGKAASHGCIRMAKRDLEQFFEMVRVGDTVVIRAEADEQTAQIFGATETVVAAGADGFNDCSRRTVSESRTTGLRTSDTREENANARRNDSNGGGSRALLLDHVRAAAGGIHFRRTVPPAASDAAQCDPAASARRSFR